MKKELDLKFDELDDFDLNIPSKKEMDQLDITKKKELKLDFEEDKKYKKKEYDILKKESKKNEKVIVIVLLIILIFITLFGFYYLYTNYIDIKDCNTQEECFYLAIKNCDIFNYSHETESISFISYTNLKYNYQIIGLNENNECLINIMVEDAKITFDKENLLNYLDDFDNQIKVYNQVILFSKQEDSFFKNIKFDWTPNSIKEVIDVYKSIINDHFNNINQEELNVLENQKREELERSIGIIKECSFEHSEKLFNFIQDHIKRRTISSTYDSEIIDGHLVETRFYNGGKCISKTPI